MWNTPEPTMQEKLSRGNGYKQYATDMDRKITIEEVRSFIAAVNKQFEQGGILISRIRFHRSEAGTVEEIYIDYEERDNQTGGQGNE